MFIRASFSLIRDSFAFSDAVIADRAAMRLSLHSRLFLLTCEKKNRECKDRFFLLTCEEERKKSRMQKKKKFLIAKINFSSHFLILKNRNFF